jgi:hypothetical protein
MWLWSKGTCHLLKLRADLGVVHMILVWRHTASKNYRVMEASTQISKEGLAVECSTAGLKSLWAVPDTVVCEA